MQPKLVLIQARNPNDIMARHEVECFADKIEVSPDNIAVRNLLVKPVTTQELLQFDAVILGGSGAYYASKADLPGFTDYLDVVGELCDLGHPTLGVCYGFHCMARALGAEVIHDPKRCEVGTFPMQLTPQGQQDPLLGTLPKEFNAQMGHKDHVVAPPAGFPTLVESDLSPHQAFRVGLKSVWAVQFHPELDVDTNKDRFIHYLEGYGGNLSAAERDQQLLAFQPSVEASTILKAFLNLVFD